MSTCAEVSDGLTLDDLLFICSSHIYDLEAFIVHSSLSIKPFYKLRFQTIFTRIFPNIPQLLCCQVINKATDKFISRICTMFFIIPQTIKVFIGAVATTCPRPSAL